MLSTDHDWEAWGQQDPYFGVITHEKYRAKNITKADKLDFFKSGEAHIEHVLSVCRQHFSPNFMPTRVLDFGCGVGRLVVPLSAIASEVVGIDVSESMLREARKNCEEHKIKNVKFVRSDDELSELDGEFDFIHSYIVLQHIPVCRGNHIFLQLLEHLSEGGIAVIHMTYFKNRRQYKLKILKIEWLRSLLRKVYGLSRHYWRLLSRDGREALMQMNTYNLNEIFHFVQSAGIGYSVSEFTNHDGELGVLLYFRKPPQNSDIKSKL